MTRSHLARLLLLVSCVGALGGRPATAEISFAPAMNFPSGSSVPNSIAAGDFNGDGNLDLAVTHRDGDNVAVLLGRGDGSLADPVIYAIGPGAFPTSVSVGDFNGDGILDLAVTKSRVGTEGQIVSVLLGNGDGTFQPARNYPEGVPALSSAVGDFNGDGNLDLLIGGNGSGSVLLGNGDGSFQAPIIVDAGFGVAIVFIVAQDFDADGKIDLAVANFTDNRIAVLAGNGDGTFRFPVIFPVGTGPSSIAVGDFNGDGAPDLAVTNVNSNNISILINQSTP